MFHHYCYSCNILLLLKCFLRGVELVLVSWVTYYLAFTNSIFIFHDGNECSAVIFNECHSDLMPVFISAWDYFQ